MNFIEKIIRFCQGTFSNKTVKDAKQDIVALRQNSPPDERDVDVAEEVRSHSGTGRFDEKDKSGKKTKTWAKKAGGST